MAIKRRKRNRKPDSIPALTKKLDSVFSRFVRLSAVESDGLIPCFTCGYRGAVEKMQAGHWLVRQHKSTRWEEWNVKPQCFACNMWYGGRSEEFRARLIIMYGREHVEKLSLRRHEVKKWTREELQGMIANYSARVAELEANFE